jgi:hypothetical protein
MLYNTTGFDSTAGRAKNALLWQLYPDLEKTIASMRNQKKKKEKGRKEKCLSLGSSLFYVSLR